jgi:hypothetical protein
VYYANGTVEEVPLFEMSQIAASHSQLAGLLAGFLFLGITVLIGRVHEATVPGRLHNLSQALHLLSTGFVVLLVTSFLFGVVSSYSNVPIAWSLLSITAVLLAIGAVNAIASLGWVVEHFRSTAGVNRYLKLLAAFVYLIATLWLSFTASDAIRGSSPSELHWIFLIGSIPGGAYVVTSSIVWLVKRVRSGRIRDSSVTWGVQLSCYAMLMAVFIVVATFLIISSEVRLAEWQAILVNALGIAAFHVASISMLLTMPQSQGVPQGYVESRGYL